MRIENVTSNPQDIANEVPKTKMSLSARILIARASFEGGLVIGKVVVI